jgi:hypothetical protein
VRNDRALFVNRILPVISYDKFDAYALFEPYRQSGEYLISDDVIMDWYQSKNRLNVNLSTVFHDIERTLINHVDDAMIYSNRAAIQSAIAGIRKQITDASASRPRNIIAELEKHYVDLERNNKIGNVGPIYPQDLFNYYHSNPGLKMLHDELRYVTFGAFKSLEAAPFDIGHFTMIKTNIIECLSAASSDDRARAHKVLNKSTLRYMISPSDNIDEIKVFVYSTMFLYIPMTSEEADKVSQKYSVRRPDADNLVLYNISKNLHGNMAKILAESKSGAGEDNIIALLRDLDVSSLDEATIAEIRAKFC